MIVEHCLLNCSIEPIWTIPPDWDGLSDGDTKKIISEFQSIPLLLEMLKHGSPVDTPALTVSDEDSDAGKQGYITYHVMNGTNLPELDISNAKTENSANSTVDNQKSIEIYEEFLPILLKQHSSKGTKYTRRSRTQWMSFIVKVRLRKQPSGITQ